MKLILVHLYWLILKSIVILTYYNITLLLQTAHYKIHIVWVFSNLPWYILYFSILMSLLIYEIEVDLFIKPWRSHNFTSFYIQIKLCLLLDSTKISWYIIWRDSHISFKFLPFNKVHSRITKGVLRLLAKCLVTVWKSFAL